MSKNTGKDFEKLTQEVYQAICDFDAKENGYKKIQVQHDVKIQGKSGTFHQIDVFWEFNLAEISYKTLVEVKDWKSPVEKEQISGLKGKLDDIPNSCGIFVSRAGFQKGAKIYAEHYGIQLITITEDTELKIAINSITTHYDCLKIEVDTDDLQNKSFNNDYFEKVCREDLGNIVVINPDKIPDKIFNLMCKDAESYYYARDKVRHHIRTALDGDWYVLSNKGNFPLQKIHGYSFDCYNTSERCLLSLKNLPIVCIKNVLKGTEKRYNKNEQSIIAE